MTSTPVVATYDVLKLVAGMSAATATHVETQVGATEQEIHALAYLACQLSKWQVADLEWGYTFYTTEHAEPFAAELSSVIAHLSRTGALHTTSRLLRLTSRGNELLDALDTHPAAQQRQAFLDTAIQSVFLISVPLVLRGISHDPTLAPSHPSRALLDEVAMNVLSEYHDALRSAIGPNGSLSSLAELWIRYLLAASDSEVA